VGSVITLQLTAVNTVKTPSTSKIKTVRKYIDPPARCVLRVKNDGA
jgi:hypothetical protein